MSQAQREATLDVEQIPSGVAGWHRVPGGDDRFWDGLEWADYVPAPVGRAETWWLDALEARTPYGVMLIVTALAAAMFILFAFLR
ncbi:MAG: hypothetical protein ABI873_13840 [Marmoricola sp.]